MWFSKRDQSTFNCCVFFKGESRGSYLKSLIKDEKITSYIIEMADRYKEYFGKYSKDVKIDEHILYLIEIILMIDDEITQIKKTTVERKLRNLKMKKIEELDKKYMNLIEKMYSNRILNKYNFSKKIVINVLLYGKDKEIDEDKMEIVIDRLHNIIEENKKKIGNNREEINKLIEKIYNDDYDEDDEEEEEEEEEEGEEEEEKR